MSDWKRVCAVGDLVENELEGACTQGKDIHLVGRRSKKDTFHEGQGSVLQEPEQHQ